MSNPKNINKLFPNVPSGNINITSDVKRRYSAYVDKLNEFKVYLNSLSLKIFKNQIFGIDDNGRHAICKNISILSFFIDILINVINITKSKITKNTASSTLRKIELKKTFLDLFDSIKSLNISYRENIRQINDLIQIAINTCTSYYTLEFIPK